MIEWGLLDLFSEAKALISSALSFATQTGGGIFCSGNVGISRKYWQ
jgi:hypothetical protein